MFTLVKIPHCWKSHDKAHLSNTFQFKVSNAFQVLQLHTLITDFILGLQILKLFMSGKIYLTISTVLQDKSDSDVMIVYKLLGA